jgi:ribosome biogenesis GTPase
LHFYCSLEALGFNDFYRQALVDLDDPQLVPARVASSNHGHLQLLTEEGPRTGFSGSHPCVVGDWLAVHPAETPRVAAILPRRTDLGRQAAGRRTERQVLAANVDVVWLVTALSGDLNPRRLERYLAAIVSGGAEPVIVVNKIDLDPTGIGRASKTVAQVAPGCQVVLTSALFEDGLQDLAATLGPGRTAVLVGSSGVGKSTLVNQLLGVDQMATAPVRPGDDLGRHTTTHRELHLIPRNRGILIDTPGIRELKLWDGDALDAVFPELADLAERCQYRDCSHQGEEGCAIAEAVRDGIADADRVESWHKLQREAARHDQRKDDWRIRKARRTRARAIRNRQRQAPRKLR